VKKRTFLCAPGTLVLARAGWAADTRRLRYGGDAAFAPFESQGAQGRPQGFQIDLLSELGAEIGVAFDVTLQPWAQTEADFKRGQLDVIAMVDTSQRRQWARFTRGHATPTLAIYQRSDRAGVNGVPDLVGLRIAVLDGDAMRDTLARWLPAVPGPFVRVDDAAQALAAVQDGRADVALLPRAYADPLLTASAGRGITASSTNLALQSYAFAVAPGQQALQAQLQQGLDRLEANGRLEVLRTRWLSSHRAAAEQAMFERDRAAHRGWMWSLAGVSGAALALMGTGLWWRGRRIATEQQARARAETALRQTQELLDRTFARHADAMLIVERGSGIVRDANAALLALLGVTAERFIGSSLRADGAAVDAAALQALTEALAESGALDAMPLRVQRGDGQARDCLVSADALQIDGAPHVFCIVRDITEQLTQDAAMRSGYDALAAQLAQAQRERDAARQGQAQAQDKLSEFTRAVAHDLKAPLRAVQGFAGLLRERVLAGHAQEALEYLSHIDRAAQRMSMMIGALGRLGQVTQHPLERRSIDMKRLAQETWALIGASHPARRTAFSMADLPVAQGDPDLTAQVWQNLLDNAAKYSADVAEPKVALDSFADARGTWYRVTDNGAGFDSDKAGRLFQPFARMHTSQQFEGSGVGLSLVQRIVDHHRGEIRLRSAPQIGTVVEFTLDPPPL
jgi:PAS domain S-box-containing protein